MEKTPRELGFTFPPEWGPHEATWMSYPRPDGISFPGRYDRCLDNWCRIARAVADEEPLRVLVGPDDMPEARRRLPFAELFEKRTDEPWARDHGPAFVTDGRELAVVDWRFNAWGGKYEPWDDDDAAPRFVAETLGLRRFEPGVVMEGGSVDFDGRGGVLTTTDCLLHPTRNPSLDRRQIERAVCDYYGQQRVHWITGGIAGDDTDGHIDDLARFARPGVIVAADERVIEQCAWIGGYDIERLPEPEPFEIDGEPVPATHVNFYFAGDAVLIPTFGGASDDRACGILAEATGRRAVGVDCRDVIWGLGAIHCLTQQQPRMG